MSKPKTPANVPQAPDPFLAALTRSVDAKELAVVQKRLDWLLGFLIVNFKFIHQVLGMMNKIQCNPTKMAMPTMGVRVVNGRLDLMYNPAYVLLLSDECASWVFYHEVLHVVLHHCTSRHAAVFEKEKERFEKDGEVIVSDVDLWNIASDLAVNELIPEIPEVCLMPRKPDGTPSVLKVTEFAKNPKYKDIQERQTAEWYYEFLRSKAQGQGKGKGKGQGEGQGKGQGEGQGKDDLSNGGKRMDDHSGWKEDELATEKIRAKVREIQQTDSWGSVPQTEREMIMAAQNQRINWRNKIRQFFGLMVWKDKMSTRKRPNRRMGFQHPGYRRLLVDRYLVAVDTSGSIDSVLLSLFLGVVNGLTDYMPIDIMQFDCAMTSKPAPFEMRKAKFEFKGRGGTDFQPVIDIVDRMHYRGCIILTDGCASAPVKPKGHVNLLWVLPPNHNPPVEWGDRVHMSKYA